ncbi:uncharacterized protein M6B38_344545 [Iris pallida]|uniref:Presenilin n=1 Tax=Iris pallida TaxID=29817 RepID=A0AAX6GUM5_IRIPA|nr:uncharacterized protein M6B38_344545 [Iris pallida]
MSSSRESSIVDTLGAEILSVISPVSVCMLLVVLLVSLLSPPPSPSSSSAPAAESLAPMTAATLVYQESSSDPTSARLSGALLNAAAFVALVAAVTFLLVLLYYLRCTGFLRNYTRFSAFFVLSSMGGSILLSILRRLSLPLDAPSALLLLLNFSLLGVVSIFSSAVPILVRQSYMVSLGVIVAAWFTRLPEWTTWSLLLALSLYDLAAVLCPVGPLRLLVELAQSRDEDLPALVYEARPSSHNPNPPPIVAITAATTSEVELQQVSSSSSPSSPSPSVVVEIEETAPLVVASTNPSPSPSPSPNPNPNPNSNPSVEEEDEDGLEMMESGRGIRLGLGDFVFYGVLVGRAAMYDLMTVYACYLAIVSGLGCTLILLAVWRRALPALPISITLGMAFYFLTRLLMEPFVVGLSTSLVMF